MATAHQFRHGHGAHARLTSMEGPGSLPPMHRHLPSAPTAALAPVWAPVWARVTLGATLLCLLVADVGMNVAQLAELSRLHSNTEEVMDDVRMRRITSTLSIDRGGLAIQRATGAVGDSRVCKAIALQRNVHLTSYDAVSSDEAESVAVGFWHAVGSPALAERVVSEFKLVAGTTDTNHDGPRPLVVMTQPGSSAGLSVVLSDFRTQPVTTATDSRLLDGFSLTWTSANGVCYNGLSQGAVTNTGGPVTFHLMRRP